MVAPGIAEAERGEVPLLASLGTAVTSHSGRRSCCIAHLGVAITGVFLADEGAVSGGGILGDNVRLGEGTFGDAMGVRDTPITAVPKLVLAGNGRPGDSRGCRDPLGDLSGDLPGEVGDWAREITGEWVVETHRDPIWGEGILDCVSCTVRAEVRESAFSSVLEA